MHQSSRTTDRIKHGPIDIPRPEKTRDSEAYFAQWKAVAQQFADISWTAGADFVRTALDTIEKFGYLMHADQTGPHAEVIAMIINILSRLKSSFPILLQKRINLHNGRLADISSENICSDYHRWHISRQVFAALQQAVSLYSNDHTAPLHFMRHTASLALSLEALAADDLMEMETSKDRGLTALASMEFLFQDPDSNPDNLTPQEFIKIALEIWAGSIPRGSIVFFFGSKEERRLLTAITDRYIEPEFAACNFETVPGHHCYYFFAKAFTSFTRERMKDNQKHETDPWHHDYLEVGVWDTLSNHRTLFGLREGIVIARLKTYAPGGAGFLRLMEAGDNERLVTNIPSIATIFNHWPATLGAGRDSDSSIMYAGAMLFTFWLSELIENNKKQARRRRQGRSHHKPKPPEKFRPGQEQQRQTGFRKLKQQIKNSVLSSGKKINTDEMIRLISSLTGYEYGELGTMWEQCKESYARTLWPPDLWTEELPPKKSEE